MGKIEDKQLEHLASMQAIMDYSWHSWNSAVGLSLGLIGIGIFLNILVVSAILIKFLFIMK